jgi:hypothetical protein
MASNINNGPENNHTEHIDHALEEARITVLGEEVIKAAENLTYYSGAQQPEDTIDEAESITFLAGVTEPAETIRDAELITSYETEVKGAGEDLPEGEEIDETMADEATQILNEHNQQEEESLEDKRAREKYLAAKKKAKERAVEMNKRMQQQIDQGEEGDL